MMAYGLSQKQFTAKDIYRILGVDKNRLFHWINTHRLLEPDIDEGGGRGNKRRFSRNNLLELEIIRELLHYGIELRMVQHLKKTMDDERIEAKLEDGKWVPIEKKGVPNSKKFNLYDWAFEAGVDTRAIFYYARIETLDAPRFYLLIGKSEKPWVKDVIQEISSYLIINITNLASSILERAANG
jgi:DNA-binding transcriptional MerR regulator